MMHNLLSFDWVNVPLVYTQVVHVCTVAYFGIICFSNQSISEVMCFIFITQMDEHIESSFFKDSETWINELVIPVFAIYEFIFFVGWLKVAQVMLNPFGMDDDDFDIDMLVERNLQVTSFLFLPHYVLHRNFSMIILQKVENLQV
uniref:Bestrophin homolog n=1 Tax=Angiostrongylus cantonensis TaxID=6313 RepID=A0A0K0DI67_ANGCA